MNNYTHYMYRNIATRNMAIRNVVIRNIVIALLITLAPATALHADDAAASVAIKTATVVEKPVAESLSVYGVLNADPDQVLSVSLPHSGLITRVWVRAGQRVNRGDKLIEITASPDAHMQFVQAQSAMEFAEHELQRKQKMRDEQLATQADVDAAQKNLNDAEAALNALRQRGLGTTEDTLRAPVDGIITELNIAQGQRLAADASVLLIAAQDRLIARLGIEPEALPQLHVGTPLTITSAFLPNVNIDSTIREVHAMIDPTTNLVEALAAIPSDKVDHLVLGSRIVGRIHFAPHNALVVPRSAVLNDADGAYVFTINNGQAHRVAVSAGIEAGDELEVSGALNNGDKIVAVGNYELSDGMNVREVTQ